MKTKRFLQLAEKLDEALMESVDIFLAQRPFIEDKNLEPEILSLTDEEIERKIDNEVILEKVLQEICSQ